MKAFSRPIVVLSAVFSAALASIFLISTQEIGGLGLLFGVVGLLMILCRPVQRPPVVFPLLILAAGGMGFAALLPGEWFGISEMRSLLAGLKVVPLANTVSLQPVVTLFWASTFMLGAIGAVYLSMFPLRTRGLEVFATLVTVLVAVYALLAIISRETGWKPVFHNGAPFGFLPNRNHTATLLVVGVISSVGLAFYEFQNRRSWLGTLGIVAAVIPLIGLMFYSESRAGVLLAALACVLWVAGIGPRVIGVAGWATAAVLIVAAGYFFLTEDNPVRARLGEMAGALPVGGSDGDFRVKIFRDTLEMAKDYPLTGVGIGNFAAVFRQYRQQSLVESETLHPESDVLLVASEMGWPAVVLLGGALVVLVSGVFRERGYESWPLRWALATGVIVAVLHGFVDVPWHRAQLGWALLAVGMAGLVVPRERAQAGRVLQIGFIAIGACFLLTGVRLANAQWGKGKMPEALVEPLLLKRVETATKEQRFEDAEALAGRAIVTFPLAGWPYYFMAGNLLNWEDTDADAAANFRAWRTLDPVWPMVPIQEARLWSRVDVGRAAEAYTEALRRARGIDELSGRKEKAAPGTMANILRETAAMPALQDQIGNLVWEDPEMRAAWIAHATPALVEARADARNAGLDECLAGVEDSALIEGVLGRWNALGHRAAVIAWISRERERSGDRLLYWRSVAQASAMEKNFETAVREASAGRGIVIEAEWMSPQADVVLLSPMERELRNLLLKRNDVAANRVISSVLAEKAPLESRLLTVLQAQVYRGEWEKAWRTLGRIPERRR